MTIKRLISLIIVIPIAIVLVAFIAANREMVVLTLNPFQSGDDALTYRAPLFLWLFLALLIGIVLAGIIGWINQLKLRRALRQLKNELEKMKLDKEQRIDTPE